MSGELQVGTQLPLMQESPEAHIIPHLPQFEASVWVSTQASGLPHALSPEGQQSPDRQLVPVGQIVPQAPQLAESVARLVQTPLAVQ